MLWWYTGVYGTGSSHMLKSKNNEEYMQVLI